MSLSSKRRLLDLAFKRKTSPQKNRFFHSHSRSLSASMNPRFSQTQFNQRPVNQQPDKPVPLKLIEDYFSSICSSMQKGYSVPRRVLQNSGSIRKALDDTTKQIPNLSIFFYNLVRDIIRHLEKMYLENLGESEELLNMLIELATFIKEKKYISEEHSVEKYKILVAKQKRPDTFQSLKQEVDERLCFITIESLRTLSKFVQNPDAKLIVKGLFTLVSSIDKSIIVSRDQLFPTVLAVSSVPERAVMIIRRILEYIDQEVVTEQTIEKISQMMGKVRVDNIQSGAAIILYELLNLFIQYYSMVSNSEFMNYKRLIRPCESRFSTPPKSPAKLFIKKTSNLKTRSFVQETIQQNKIQEQFIKYLIDKIQVIKDSSSLQSTVASIIEAKQFLIRDFISSTHAPQIFIQKLSMHKTFLMIVHRAFSELKVPHILNKHLSNLLI